MSVYRYINNTAVDIEKDGFIVRAYDELMSHVEVPVLTAVVDGKDLVGLKDGMPINYVVPQEAPTYISDSIELHVESETIPETSQEVTQEATPEVITEVPAE